MKAWDYARTIFESEKLRIAYIKAEIGTGKHTFRYDATRRDAATATIETRRRKNQSFEGLGLC